MNMLQPVVNCLLYFDKPPTLTVLADAFEDNFWPNYRFHSIVEDGYWVATDVLERNYHFVEHEVSNEAAVDEWVQSAMLEQLDESKPQWRIFLVRARSGRSGVFCRLHHSIGDGLGLLFAMGPLMSRADGQSGNPLSTLPLPSAMMPKSLRQSNAQEVKPSQDAGGGCGCRSVCTFFKGALLPVTLGPDDHVALNPPLEDRTPHLPFNGKRHYYRLPPVPLATVKKVRERYGCSVNDVIMAALAGALRRYGAENLGDEKLRGSDRINFKSMFMMGLPRPIDDNDIVGSLANKILFASCPMHIDQDTPEKRIEQTMHTFNNLKSKAFMTGLVGFTDFATGVMPTSIRRKIVSETFTRNHSLLVTNVPGPTVPVVWPKNGEVLSEVQMVFPNCIPQFSILSYRGEIQGNVVADPALLPDPASFGMHWRQEFEILAES
eukprot:TRINITY_DN26399_c0_g1_i1.p1 TRINITY_DN26399_c0_g1~~TRINITY_DN26399_c0_g1_i1.p1  ORF type:complete len:493 (-),score=41.99 TRINITY_DN26399_c0_g1_i1:93-1397(-)